MGLFLNVYGPSRRGVLTLLAGMEELCISGANILFEGTPVASRHLLNFTMTAHEWIALVPDQWVAFDTRDPVERDRDYVREALRLFIKEIDELPKPESP